MPTLEEDISRLGLSVRSQNALRRAGISRVAQLVPLTDEELFRISGIGITTFTEIKDKLDLYQVSIADRQLLVNSQGDEEPEQSLEAEVVHESDSASPAELASNPFLRLAERYRVEIEYRWGLHDGVMKDFRQASMHMGGVSIQRVRQIEMRGLDRLQSDPVFLSWCKHLETSLEESGGLATDDEICQRFESLAGHAGYNTLQLAELLAHTAGLGITHVTLNSKRIWMLGKMCSPDTVVPLHHVITDVLKHSAYRQPPQLLAALKRRPDCPPGISNQTVLALLRVSFELPVAEIGLMVAEQLPSSTIPESIPNLQEWEAKLEPLVSSLEHLGRVPVTPEQCADIGQCFMQMFQTCSVEETLELCESSYAAVFVVFLIAQNRYDRHDVDTWQARAQATGLPLSVEEFQKQLELILSRVLTRFQLLQLHGWEFRFRPRIRRVELVGEIPISAEESAEIGQCLSQILQRKGVTLALKMIEMFCPVTFAVFLVAQGVYGYKGGDYWSELDRSLGLRPDGNFHTRLGSLFEKILEHYHLALFFEMREHATRYVSLILAHGGIPSYCLKDYFDYFVLPAVQRPQLAGLQSEDLIDEMLRLSVIQSIDKPVIHFLENGGRAAVDFVNRSRHLLQEWFETQTVPGPDEVGLPEHIVRFFGTWASTVKIRDKDSGTARLRRPEIRLDPWGLGVFLYLPAQPLARADELVQWQVHSEGLDKTIPVRIRRIGQDLETAEAEFRLDRPCMRYEIVLQIGNQTYTWEITGLSLDKGIAAFDPKTGVLQSRLSTKELWLLYPIEMQLESHEGEAQIIEELPRLPNVWCRFRCQGWDLSRARELVLKDGQVQRVLPIWTGEMVSRPFLVGGTPLNMEQASDHNLVYVGEPPILRIPFTGDRGLDEELRRWRIKIDSVGPAMPDLTTVHLLSEMMEKEASICGNCVDVKLAAAGLGPRPMGAFRVGVHGPMGRDVMFEMQFLPEFQVRGLEHIYFPDPIAGSPRAVVEIGLGLLDRLEVADKAIQIESKKGGAYRLTVPGSVCELNMAVVRDLEDDASIRIRVRLEVPRLRWQLLGADADETAWSSSLATLPIQTLLRQMGSLLLVDLPGIDVDSLVLQLRLVDMERIERQVVVASSHRKSSRYWRFELGQFNDTIRSLDLPLARLELECAGLLGVEGLTHVPLLNLTRQLDIHGLRCETREIETGWQLSLSWRSAMVLRSCAAYLWPLWRPWHPPYRYRLPDGATGDVVVDVSRDMLPAGYYRLSLAVVDPWLTDLSRNPVPAQNVPGVVDLQLVDPETRLGELEQHLSGSEAFESRLEQALIQQQYLGQVQNSRQALEWCLAHLNQAAGRALVSLHELLNPFQDLKVRFGARLFESDCINRVLEFRRDGVITGSQYGQMLHDAPPPHEWSLETCLLLIFSTDQHLRSYSIGQMVTRDTRRAVLAVIHLTKEGTLSQSESIQFLYEEKNRALECLETFSQDTQARQLSNLLKSYRPGRFIRSGNWVMCDAGWGRIERIEDPITHQSVVEFLEGQGEFRLHVALHIELSDDLKGELAVINMPQKEIVFPRKPSLFVCLQCNQFATGQRNLYQSHLFIEHVGAYPVPARAGNSMALTFLEFEHKIPDLRTQRTD